MAKNTTGANSGMAKELRKDFAAYREANQPQMRITRRRIDKRATHTLPDGASKKQNKPSLLTRTRQMAPNPGVARGTALPSSGNGNPAASGGMRMPTRADRTSGSGHPGPKPTRGFDASTERNLRQVGKRNKTK